MLYFDSSIPAAVVPKLGLGPSIYIFQIIPEPASAITWFQCIGNRPPAAVPGACRPMNYVRTFVPWVPISSHERVLKGSVDSVQVSATYFDGLGRLVQTVTRQESPLKRDVIQPIAYDAFSRQAKDYPSYTTEPDQSG